MPVLTTAEQLLELVRKSRLIEEDRLAETLQRTESANGDAAALSRTLIEHGLITAWQSGQLLAGKWRGFFIAGGKYKLLDLLGVGGMGKVYLCEHCRMQRLVALKILPIDRLHEPTSLERFEREARAAGALHHVNIVRAFDLDRDGDLHFLVMEYVDGASLHQIVKKTGPLEIRRACHYISQAAEGLQHAHEAARLVHRDIKPGNILVDRSGTVKILDMGLARFFQDEEGSLTRRHDRNAVLGTADYLAPEQALNSSAVDIRADIYSLGATFYYILAGRNLFDRGSVAEKLIWHQVREPAPLHKLRANVPRDLEAIITRMMAKKPESRFQEPIEVVAALERWTREPVDPPAEAEMPQKCPALHSLAPSGGGSPSSGSGRGSSTRSTKSLRGARTAVAPAAGRRWIWLVPLGVVLAAAAALIAWWSRLPTGAPPAIQAENSVVPAAAPPIKDLPGPDALPAPAEGVLVVTADPRLMAAAAGRPDVVGSFGQALALAGTNQRIVVLDGHIEGQFRVDARTAGLAIEGREPGIAWSPAEGASADEPLLTLAHAGAARISGIAFDGGGLVRELIRIEGDAAGMRLERLRLAGARTAQIQLRGAAADVDRRLEIEAVRFTTIRCQAGIAITDGAGPDLVAASVVNCRFEGDFGAAVRIDGPVDLDLRRCRFWSGREPGDSASGDTVSLETSGIVRLRLASNTAAGWTSFLRLRRLPASGSTVQLRSNLLVDGPAFVAAEGGIEVDRLRELVTPSAGNVAGRGQAGAGVAVTPLRFLDLGWIERRPDAADFLLYSRTGDGTGLLTAGAGGEPAGVPPPE